MKEKYLQSLSKLIYKEKMMRNVTYRKYLVKRYLGLLSLHLDVNQPATNSHTFPLV